jgi:hypothetical protein
MKRLCRALFFWSCVACLFGGPGRAADQHIEDFTSTTYKDPVNTTADWDTGSGELRLFPFEVSLTGSYDTPGLAWSAAVEGDVVLVADNTTGLQVLDISNPADPTQIGDYDTPGMAYDVAAAGDLAFVADGGWGLQIIDITDPTNPTFKGTYDTPGSAWGVAAAGDLVLVADYTGGLQIVDITNPAGPTLAGDYDTPGLAFDVAVAGDLAFVADGTSGLQIIDITDPTTPTFEGTYDTPGSSALGVVVSGDLAFVADADSGLQIIDITDPGSPTLSGTYETPGVVRDVAIAGDVALLAVDASGLQIIDITDPTNPTLLDSYDTPGAAQGVEVSGGFAFVSDYASGLQIIDFADWGVGPYIGGYDTPDEAFDVALAGNFAFVADRASGLQIVDITSPAGPTLAGTCDTPGEAFGVALAGDLAFVADGASGLEVIDITNPASPSVIKTFATASTAFDVAVAGDLVLVADDAGLQIIDVEDPANPSLAGAYPVSAYGVAVAGDLAYVAGGTSLVIVDITNPTSPTLAGSFVGGVESNYVDVAVAGDIAYVADIGVGLGMRGFLILEVSNPSNVELLNWYAPASGAYGVAVAGDLALVATGSGLELIDVTAPYYLDRRGTYETPGEALSVAVAGDLAFAADGSSGLCILQVFQREVDGKRDIGQSLSVDASPDTIIRARLSTTQTAGVAWEVRTSASSFQSIVADTAWTEIWTPGSDLRWRSIHTWNGVNPAVSSLRLEWLYEHAIIDAVTDIPGDQGKQVRIEWTRSGHDFVGDSEQIVEYAIYRKIGSNPGSATLKAREDDFAGLSLAARDNALLMQAAGWDFITTVPVLVQDSYAAVVPTLADSTIASGQHFTTFRVTALTATPGVYFHSAPDSGYSVDNLAPSVPGNFTVAYNTGGGNALSWDEPPDDDFQYFRVYRSTDPEFAPSFATLVKVTTFQEWVDPEYDAGGVFYKVTATDFSGNESDAATAETVTDVGRLQLPRAFALHSNLPNPFNPRTLIRYDVPEGGGEVTLRIFDVSGRLVKTLVAARRSAGRQSVRWDGRDEAGRAVASGVYFCRMQADSFVQTRKLVLLE